MMNSTRRHIYLAGFMGTGKSATGQALAKSLARPFYDLDAVVEQITGQTIPVIFATDGESEFRKYEAHALRSIVSGAPSVIALGGGAPTVPSIARLAHYTGRTVWLTADWPTVWERVRSDTNRPLLAEVLGEDPSDGGDEGVYDRFVERAKQLLAQRERSYDALADWTVSTSDASPAEAAGQIIRLMKDPAE